MQIFQLLRNPSKRLWNVANTHWWQGVHTGLTPSGAKRPRNLRMAKRPPRSSEMRRDDKHRAKWPNGLLMPSKPARNDFAHSSGTLRDPRRRGRIKTKPKNVSRSETRGSKPSKLIIPIPPPRELAKPLWNVANTYWRHGIPPGRSRNIENLLLFETAASSSRYKVKMSAHYVHFRNGKLPHRAPNTTKHHSYTTRTRSSFAAE
ncbi:hypothetical protein EDC04DRAFT_2606584 [Pisolithus marmoratus]|nr:hypothetical protein EDC04DRAFT_2606584 [Pisolithus marmoratus]